MSVDASPVLTDAMRRWLVAPGRSAMRTCDVMFDFLKVFQLTPERAGDAIVEWSNEQGRRL